MGVLAGHTHWVTHVRFLPDGKKAVTASHDGTARLWDLHTGSCRHVLEGHTGRINALALSPDGRRCATGGEDGTARVWDLRRGKCRRVLTVSGSAAHCALYACQKGWVVIMTRWCAFSPSTPASLHLISGPHGVGV